MVTIDWHPAPEKLRQFAYFAPVGFGLIGLLVAWHLGAPGNIDQATTWTPSFWLWGTGLVTLLIGAIKPLMVKPLYVVLSAITAPLGWLIGNLVLLLLFSLLVAPLGILFRLIGRDALDRHFRDGSETYWRDHESATDLKRYYRQY